MNLKPWSSKGDLQKVEVTEKTLSDLLDLIKRDLKDSLIQELSLDRRFATAYGAALNLASYVIRKEGYRVSAKRGHHKVTFDVAGEILGSKAIRFINFFDVCRRKRNKVDYDLANVVTETELNELIKMLKDFKKIVNGD